MHSAKVLCICSAANARIMAYSFWIWWTIFVYVGVRLVLIPKQFHDPEKKKLKSLVDLASLFALIYAMVLNVTLSYLKEHELTAKITQTSIQAALDFTSAYFAYQMEF